jgi:NAD(P)-dependent dehydrogenase (short-subunit alcohol dehydrogenase family)
MVMSGRKFSRGLAMTEQQPIGSGYGAATTAAEVITGRDLTGKVAIVTGGYSGLGLVTARTLAAAGAEVIVPARDQAKASAALAGAAGITLERMDLMDPASIDAFAERFLATGRPLHLLINAGGVMAPPLVRDGRGNESQFSTNHLGHFQLTARLWPALVKANGARVVAVSSRGHKGGAVDLDDPNFERRDYNPWAGYSQSKTANILFALELDRRGASEGVRAFSLHPGGIMTDLMRHMNEDGLRNFGFIDEAGRPVLDPAKGKKTPEQGAATIVWCATSPQLDGMGGVYCEDCEVAGIADGTETRLEGGVRAFARDPEIARRLWTLSEQLTRVSFPALHAA